MSNDLRAALMEIQYDIKRLQTNLDAVLLRKDLPNRELIEWSSHLIEVIEDCTRRGLNDGE